METFLHAFRDCPLIQNVWSTFPIPLLDQLNPDINVGTWIEVNARSHDNSNLASIPWASVFPFIMWGIWLDRNVIVHPPKDGKKRKPLIKDIRDSAIEFWAINPSLIKPSRSIWRQVGWKFPRRGFVKHNSDGAAETNPGMAAAGGVIRNSNGKWIIGYCRKIRLANSLIAELIGLRDGMQLLIDKGFTSAEIESDSSVAVALINNLSVAVSHYFLPVINDCRTLLRQILNCSLQHTYREGNTVADDFSKHGLSLPFGFYVFDVPIHCTSASCTADVVGISYPRLCDV